MPTKNSIFAIIPLGLALAGVACVPIPHRYQHDPDIHGSIEFGETNHGLSTVRLFRCVSSDNGCPSEQEVAVGTIEDSGEFTLEGSRKLAAYAPSMGHCNWQWKVNFYDTHSEVLGFHAFGRSGPCVAPDIVELDCWLQEEGLVRCESSGI